MALCLSPDETCSAAVCGGIAHSAGSLELTPSQNTGFWEATAALFVHTEVFAGPFGAYTAVMTADSSGNWPAHGYQLAGWAVRERRASPENADDWYKAEVGSLAAMGGGPDAFGIGLRTARATQGAAPIGSQITDHTSVVAGNPGDPAQFLHLAICRASDGRLRAWYGAVPPLVMVEIHEPSNDPIWQAEVGIIAARNLSDSVVGHFQEVAIQGLPAGTAVNDCEAWANARAAQNVILTGVR